LGVKVLILIAANLGLFIAASSLRTGQLALGLLWPQFDQGFYNTHIGLGAVAFWLLAAVVIAGLFRMRGHIHWRWLHRAVFVVFALAWLHGTGIGSETRFGLMRYVYVFIALSVLAALGSALWLVLKRGRVLAGERHERMISEISPRAARAND
jgi:predicted ferric reductase